MGNVLEPLLCKLALNHIDDDDLTIRMCLLTSRPFTILRASSYVPPLFHAHPLSFDDVASE